ncbi:hypothetical protein F5Y18DRAFT_442390 [Xylariaceae sp. FL1019]|nr:hypothetical protein F5Y18DRAFT_442390 [Xylariaceae sp. FL1019]
MPLILFGKKPQQPKRMTKSDLTKYAQKLSSLRICVDSEEALQEKSGYDNGKQFSQQLYKNGVQKNLMDQWRSQKTEVNVLDGQYRNFDSSYAGREWAAYLRVRSPDATVLRVYPKDKTASPEDILVQILISLVVNMIRLVPAEFELPLPTPRKELFESLAEGGSLGIDYGLDILEYLPPLESRGNMLCVVDGLRLADAGENGKRVDEFKQVLEKVLGRNQADLLYT